MSPVEVMGRDTVREAYRVEVSDGTRRVRGYVPETLILEGLRQGGPRHQDAYEWIARNRREIETALLKMQDGVHVRGPMNRLSLAED